MKKNLILLFFLAATFFTNAQNVGIGTTTPQTKLHIFNGSSGATPFAFSPLAVESNGHTYINILSPAANEGAILFGQPGSSANGVIMYNNTSTPNGFQFRNNGNLTRMVIDNAGNVGIGTFTPSGYGHGGTNRIMEISNPNTGSDIQSHLLLSSNGTSGPTGGITWASQNVPGTEKRLGFIGDAYETSNAARMVFYTRNESGILAEKFTVLGNGNVGIGTANPLSKLHISAGDASLALFGPNSYGANLYVGASPANQSAALTAQVITSDGNLHLDPAAGKNIYLGYFQARDIYLNPNGGNVGIGTTSAPAATLEVNGFTKLGNDAPSVKVKKLTGTTAATEGGYVFIPVGVSISKILSVSVIVTSITSGLLGPNTGGSYSNFYWYLIANDIAIKNVFGDSANILSAPIKILITYEE